MLSVAVAGWHRPEGANVHALDAIELDDHSLDALVPALEPDAALAVVLPTLLRRSLLHQEVAIFVREGVLVVGSLEPLSASARGQGGVIAVPRPAVAPHDGLRPSVADLAIADRFSSAVLAVGRTALPALDAWHEIVAAAAADGIALTVATVLDALDRRGLVVPASEPARYADWFSFGERSDIISLDIGGYDPREPHRLDAARPAPDRTPLYRIPSVAEQLLTRADPGTQPRAPLDIPSRTAYVTALREAAPIARRRPPHPFRDRARFEQWLGESDFPPPVDVSRYLRGAYLARRDVTLAYPEVPGRDTQEFYEWCRVYGQAELTIPDHRLPGPIGPRRPAVVPRAEGVNLIGFANGALGVGEYVRRMARAFEACGYPHRLVAYQEGQETLAELPFDVNIVCINPDALASFATGAGARAFEGRYTIGIWAWETAELPAAFGWACELVDEVWYTSAFGADAVRKRAGDRIPVLVMPVPIGTPAADEGFDLASLGAATDRFTFLTIFDYDSVVARKNPMAAIAAYRDAFDTSAGNQLIVKAQNALRHPDAAARVAQAAYGRPDIIVVDRHLTGAEVASLVDASDCLLSLHRAEGFGFNLADALALGKQVVATGYSGNLEYMNDDNAWLIPFELVDVGTGHHPYPSDHRWAEPDHGAAVKALRAIASGQAKAAAVPPGWTAAEVGQRMTHRLLALKSAPESSQPEQPKRRWRR